MPLSMLVTKGVRCTGRYASIDDWPLHLRPHSPTAHIIQVNALAGCSYIFQHVNQCHPLSIVNAVRTAWVCCHLRHQGRRASHGRRVHGRKACLADSATMISTQASDDPNPRSNYFEHVELHDRQGMTVGRFFA